jgi:hypothetical protein
MRASTCRWCGEQLTQPAGPGRPRLWCDQACGDAYETALGSRDHQGDVLLVETCDCGRRTEDLKGPLRAPGAWVESAAQVATALHGHPVHVEVRPAAGAVTGGTWTGASWMRDPHAVAHG